MSDVYAAPASDLQDEGSDVLNFEPGEIDIKSCFKQAWKTCWANFPGWIGVMLVGGIVATLSAITIVGYFLVIPVLGAGAAIYILNALKGEAKFSDLFSAFKQYSKYLGRFLMLGLLYALISLAFQSVGIVGDILDNSVLATIGSLMNILSIFILIRFYFAAFFIVDMDMKALDSIKASWKATSGQNLNLFLLILAEVAVLFIGVIALGIGIFPAMLIAYLMFGAAYRQLTAKA